jgi:opacity protein-like surface antigen
MNALALALALALGPAEVEEDRLPRSLADSFVEPAPAAKADVSIWVGAHLGVMGAYDAEDPNFMIGVNGRVQILSWLGAEFTLDFNTRQSYENGQIHVTQVPFEFAALFYLPVQWPVQPYGIAGVGFTITDTSYTGALAGTSDETELRRLFLLGFGAEFDLNPSIMLDANLRFIFVDEPRHFSGNSADAIQFTVGILFKLAK